VLALEFLHVYVTKVGLKLKKFVSFAKFIGHNGQKRLLGYQITLVFFSGSTRGIPRRNLARAIRKMFFLIPRKINSKDDSSVNNFTVNLEFLKHFPEYKMSLFILILLATLCSTNACFEK